MRLVALEMSPGLQNYLSPSGATSHSGENRLSSCAGFTLWFQKQVQAGISELGSRRSISAARFGKEIGIFRSPEITRSP